MEIQYPLRQEPKGFWWLSISRRGDSWLIGYNFGLPLLFSSLPLLNSCEIRLEEFCYSEPSSKVVRKEGGRPLPGPLQGRQTLAAYWLPPARAAAYRQQGQRPSVASPQKGGTRGGATRGSGAGCRGGCQWARQPLPAQRWRRSEGDGSESVEVIAGLTMPWQEITVHDDPMEPMMTRSIITGHVDAPMYK
ncbi:hypothetical protein GW17_00059380 [Ensete ventricosum]|nr:hypothetical protein GW17_00059380 [Ensete ventricosum]